MIRGIEIELFLFREICLFAWRHLTYTFSAVWRIFRQDTEHISTDLLAYFLSKEFLFLLFNDECVYKPTDSEYFCLGLVRLGAVVDQVSHAVNTYCFITNLQEIELLIHWRYLLQRTHTLTVVDGVKSSCVGVAFVGALSDEIINVHVREATKCWHCKFDDTRDYVVKLLHESR